MSIKRLHTVKFHKIQLQEICLTCLEPLSISPPLSGFTLASTTAVHLLPFLSLHNDFSSRLLALAPYYIGFHKALSFCGTDSVLNHCQMSKSNPTLSFWVLRFKFLRVNNQLVAGQIDYLWVSCPLLVQSAVADRDPVDICPSRLLSMAY